jgi:hypothetical protein
VSRLAAVTRRLWFGLNPERSAWHAAIAGRARKAKVVLLEGQAYVEKILEFPPGYFDVISVEGSHRLECFQLAVAHIGPAGCC